MFLRAVRPLVLAALLLAALPPAVARAAPDPFEAVNRQVHAFNQLARARVLGPLAELYLSATSPGFRQGLGNALANLREPVTAASGLAAGDVALAAHAAARFGINSTLGWGGVRDRAAELGYARRSFGVADALCAWGVPSGPFLMLPVLGPSTLRDLGGLAAQKLALSELLGPEVLLAWRAGDVFLGYAEQHRELDRVDAQSLDSYATWRSAYLQRRAALCPADRQAAALAAALDEADEEP